MAQLMIARFTFMTRPSLWSDVARVVGEMLLCGLMVSSPSFAVSQAPAGKPPPQERLSRIGKALLAGPGGVKEAIVELKQILAIDPRSAQAHLLLGIAYRMTGSADFIGEAKAELQQALALEPGLVPARFYLAQVYLDLGRAERAREELDTVLTQQPGHPQFLALLGEAERQLKNPSRSVELNRQALKADPSSDQARYYLGLALADLGERDEAIRELERVVKSGTTQVDVFSSLGTAYIDAGRVNEAISLLAHGTTLDPARPDLRIQLSRAYRTKGLLDKAQAQLKIVTPRAIEALASGYQQQQVDFDLQLEQGLVAMAQRRLGAAVAAFQKALTMDPNHGPAHRGLAEAYLLQRSYTLATEHAARAEKLGFPLSAANRKLLQDRPQGPGSGKDK